MHIRIFVCKVSLTKLAENEEFMGRENDYYTTKVGSKIFKFINYSATYCQALCGNSTYNKALLPIERNDRANLFYEIIYKFSLILYGSLLFLPLHDRHQ
jgi:hypothetical protein